MGLELMFLCFCKLLTTCDQTICDGSLANTSKCLTNESMLKKSFQSLLYYKFTNKGTCNAVYKQTPYIVY